ncbi:Phosphatidylinositol N-acetylglucosaminyltransferase subunit gpi15 [Ceratocystis platani]|uniref:Phosphatidylinositol N-acetylglucosaminyltransferase subunit gpi15 n=1 Tax=Ceratocystis fimbriata f. sp. platani TaxID=88771 RepID=A0A0F8BMC6_CERFI|nr:Phosphatidylinositol N-acetylglucosaminyltransferase subunit gpi15 [Ceratocystis platani]
MLATTPYLTKRCPSPTTVEYTVSNRPRPSFSQHLKASALALLRALIIASAALILWGKWNQPDCSIQTSSVAAGSLLGAPASTRFIPTEKIQDVLVNEAFHGFEVRYYLLIVVDGEEDVVVVFPKLLPGKDVVTTVWRGVKACLYEGPPDGMKMRNA